MSGALHFLQCFRIATCWTEPGIFFLERDPIFCSTSTSKRSLGPRASTITGRNRLADNGGLENPKTPREGQNTSRPWFGPVRRAGGAECAVPPPAHPDHATLQVLLEGRADPNLCRGDGVTALAGKVSHCSNDKHRCESTLLVQRCSLFFLSAFELYHLHFAAVLCCGLTSFHGKANKTRHWRKNTTKLSTAREEALEVMHLCVKICIFVWFLGSPC